MNELVAQTDMQHQSMAVMRPPAVVLEEAKIAAKALEDVISKKKKPVRFNGEQYLEFEDWQTIGKFYGLSCRTLDPEFIEIDGVKGAKASSEIVDIKTGFVLGRATAWCMRDEPNWARKPLYQLGSMAQTRAGSKGFRNLMSWVVVLAGYKTTPAEEMTEDMKNDAIVIDAPRKAVPVQHVVDAHGDTGPDLVRDILDKLVEMAEGNEDEVADHLRVLTEYQKDGKAHWVKITDLDRIAKTNQKWIAVIKSKVDTAFNKWKHMKGLGLPN